MEDLNNVELDIITEVYEHIIKSFEYIDTNACIVTTKDVRITFQKRRYSKQKVIWKYHNPQHRFTDIQVYLKCGNSCCLNIDHLFFSTFSSHSKQAILERISIDAVRKGECLIANCGTYVDGYGMVSVRGKTSRLHRVIYWIHSDIDKLCDLPSTKETNWVIRHQCKELLCLNPTHYKIGTRKENMADRLTQGTMIRGEDHFNATISNNIAQSIANSWHPKGSIHYQTQQQRADTFNVTTAVVRSIDNRITWKHIDHPNGKLPKEIWKKQKSNLIENEIDWDNLANRLKDASIAEEDDNQYTQTPCWKWKTTSKRGASLTFNNYCQYAYIWAAEYSCRRLAKNDEQARHLCGNRECVNYEHLTLGSLEENILDKRVHGTYGKKLNDEKVKFIRESSLSNNELSEMYNVRTAHIKKIKQNKAWKI